ncbi:MAG TPA: hypothetical protein VHF22_11695 [Planctomycetota bacterium]|nr:hypothetical protein [Planctomycetota bacterium]
MMKQATCSRSKAAQRRAELDRLLRYALGSLRDGPARAAVVGNPQTLESSAEELRELVLLEDEARFPRRYARAHTKNPFRAKVAVEMKSYRFVTSRVSAIYFVTWVQSRNPVNGGVPEIRALIELVTTKFWNGLKDQLRELAASKKLPRRLCDQAIEEAGIALDIRKRKVLTELIVMQRSFAPEKLSLAEARVMQELRASGSVGLTIEAIEEAFGGHGTPARVIVGRLRKKGYHIDSREDVFGYRLSVAELTAVESAGPEGTLGPT